MLIKKYLKDTADFVNDLIETPEQKIKNSNLLISKHLKSQRKSPKRTQVPSHIKTTVEPHWQRWIYSSIEEKIPSVILPGKTKSTIEI